MIRSLFSIATPTYNSLHKLRRCVGSVRGQQDAAVEHLIQDGASDDTTPDWLASQSGLHAVSEPDNGMYDAINRAWARSRGEFLSWLNADEQYLPGTLKVVEDFFAAHPEVDVVFGNYLVTNPSGRPVAARREIPFRRLYVVNGFLYMSSCTVFYRRRLFDKGLLRLDSNYKYAADKDLVLRLSEAGVVIGHIPRYLATFGIDGSNLSTHVQARHEAEDIRIAHGAMKLSAMRHLILFGRRLERLFSGGYRRTAVAYRYAVDEVPNYVEYRIGRLGGRYSLADVAGKDAIAHPVVEAASRTVHT